MPLEPIADKLKAFHWQVLEIDGHDFSAIDQACQDALAEKEKPSFIIAHTIKGKGVSFMEDQVQWHGKATTEEELEKALAELS